MLPIVRIATVASLCSGVLAVAPLRGQATRDSKADTATSLVVGKDDPRDPRTFIYVDEVTRDGKTLNIRNQPEEIRVPVPWVPYRVDRRSELRILVNRQRIIDSSIPLTLTITGQLATGSTSRPVTVHNYTSIGSQDTILVRIMSRDGVVAMAREITNIVAPDPHADTATRRLNRDLAELEDSMNARDTLEEHWEDRIALVEAAIKEGISRDDTVRLRNSRDSLSNLIDANIVAYNEQVVGYNAKLDSLLEISEFSCLRARRMARRTMRQTMLIVGRVIAKDNYVLADALAQFSGRDADVIRSYGEQLMGELIPALLDTARTSDACPALKDYQEVVSALKESARALLDSASADTADSNKPFTRALNEIVLAPIKDGYVDLRSEGARPGDRLTILITNQDDRVGTRTMEMAFDVEAFGMVSHITDSFLFLKRLGVDANASREAIDSAGQQASQSGSAGQVETPLPVDWTPTPGVTLGATWLPRSGFFRHIQPGFGLNVSFPKFGAVVTSFSSSDPSDPASQPAVTVGETGGPLDIAVGLVGSLFNNKVFVAAGTTLTASTNKEYFAVGFSFIQVASSIAGN